MSDNDNDAPHVYYSVRELSMVKDAGVMTNTRVKTVGFIYTDRDCEYKLKEMQDSDVNILLDMRLIERNVINIHPYIIFGFLCTVDGTPIVTVKSIRKFDASPGDLETYRKHCLVIRSRLNKYDDVFNLASQNHWS